jgi:peptidoglycan/LPS O-acetylase OafA/YrhL
MPNASPVSAVIAKPVPSFSVHLDAIRALAALVVFVGHGTYLYLGTSIRVQAGQAINGTAAVLHANPSDAKTHLGHQAVIIFFVLSGYFVGGGAVRALRSGRWSWKPYLLQRFARLWVVLIPALLLGVLLDTIGVRCFSNFDPAYAKLLMHGLGVTGPGHLSTATFFGNLFFLQGILVPVFAMNAPLWSLSYEFWYYILFPLLMIAAASSSNALYRVFSLALGIAIAIFCGREISIYFLIWMMGVVAYLLPHGVSEARVRRIAPVVCAAFAGFNLLVVVRPFNIVLSDFCTGFFFTAVLWLLLHYRRPAGKSLYRSAAVRLAAMSFTLYTVHYIILVFLRAWLVRDSSQRGMNVHSVAILLAVYAVTFLIAYGFYRCFEANTLLVRRFVGTRLGLNKHIPAPE